jgi:starch phosphorylase
MPWMFKYEHPGWLVARRVRWHEWFCRRRRYAPGIGGRPGQIDSANLYKVLTEQAIPTFYDRDERGIPRKWLQMVRRAMMTLARSTRLTGWCASTRKNITRNASCAMPRGLDRLGCWMDPGPGVR